MDIKQLKYFMAIAEEEQITGAARRLHMAQPPLSQQLKLLEEELGVPLFERGSRKVTLTEAGKALYNKADQIIELTNSTYNEIKDLKKGSKGTLSIGTVSTSGSCLFPSRILSFHKSYPNIHFEVFEGNTFRILEILNSGIIEIGIVRTPFNADNCEHIFLEPEKMLAVYKKGSFFENYKKDFVNLKDLACMPIIIYRRFEKLILGSFIKNKLDPDIFCKTDDARTAILWAHAGLGIAVVPMSAYKIMNDDDLCFLPINEKNLETRIAAIWMKDRYLSNAAKHFLDFFK